VSSGSGCKGTLRSDLLRLFLAILAIPFLFAAESHRKLVVISIDGLDARFLSEPALRVKAPNLRRLMREGASATVIGVAPSETWPAHASLVTGVSPWQHGIQENDRPASALKTMALWDAATARGLKTATVYWPGTLGAKIAFDLPELQETHKGNAVLFDSIAQKSTPTGLTSLIEKKFPSFTKEIWTDSSAAQAATYLLDSENPDVLFVHFSEVDSEEHETGALSIYSREALENNDDLVGQILAKVPRGTIVAVVSDHGVENSNRSVRPKVMLRQAGQAGRVEVRDGLIGTSDASVATLFRNLLKQGRKSGLAREVPMAEVRARAPGLSKWVAAFDTPPDFIANEEDHGPAVGPGTHTGAHKMWPNRPGYRSVFMVAGEGIRPLKLGEIEMLQIAPTLADVVGVKLPAAKATSLWRQISH
jgi:predicted AlkP superfamily pyrophosphatase or phosphodiesterase